MARPALSPDVDDLLARALAEDIGSGDATTTAIAPPNSRVRAVITARASGVLAGLDVARAVFSRLDESVETVSEYRDGDALPAGARVLTIHGSARAVLGGERVALNFLQHLSGVATLTRRFVDAVAGTGATVLDTRKTTPGLRALEKAAVRAGGGRNHRFGLAEMALVKENHIRVAGSVREAVARVRRAAPALCVEVEATSMEEALEALAAGVDRLMFDNARPDALASSVRRVREDAAARGVPCPVLEASGGVTLGTVRAVAEAGVDEISVGALTHSAPALDMSLCIEGVER